MLYHKKLTDILNDAKAIAENNKHTVVRVEHVLIAIQRDGTTLSARLMEEAKFDVEKQIIRVLKEVSEKMEK